MTANWMNSSETIVSHWLECTGGDYSKRIAFFVKLKWSDRLNRLFAVACCRNIWDLMKDERSRTAVETAEKYADGKCKKSTLEKAFSSASSACSSVYAAYAVAYAATYATYAASRTAAAYSSVYAASADYADRHEARLIQGNILVSMIGPGYSFSPEWKTTTVIDLAKTMYESREFSAMPILADALQDAGCYESVLLDSMRSPESSWYRGCRIVDEILGKRD